ncbi:hypothetical protein SVAN01_07564 [Stagonosporopsis vannaccii]|nr:hypothetical protein SVAN01_07564 [Stagonosporopsis vannaccii]
MRWCCPGRDLRRALKSVWFGCVCAGNDSSRQGLSRPLSQFNFHSPSGASMWLDACFRLAVMPRSPQRSKPCVSRLHDIRGWSWLLERAHAVTELLHNVRLARGFPFALGGSDVGRHAVRSYRCLAISFEI